MFLISAPFLFVFFFGNFSKIIPIFIWLDKQTRKLCVHPDAIHFPAIYQPRNKKFIGVSFVFRIAGFILKFLMMFSALKLQLVSLCRYTPNNFSRSPFNFYNSMQLKILGRHLHFLKILQISIYSKPIFFCTHKLPFLGFINIFRKKSSIKKFKSNN